jgi:hypothetical protein
MIVNEDLERRRKQLCPMLKYYFSICIERLRKTSEHLGWGSWSLGGNSNPGPPKYKTGLLITALQLSVL